MPAASPTTISYQLCAKPKRWRGPSKATGASTNGEGSRQLRKSPRGGGYQSSLAHYSPGFGMMGPPGNTTSRAPAGPRNRPSGNAGLGWKPPPGRQPYDKPSTEPWFGNSAGQQFGVPTGARGAGQFESQYDFARPNQPPPSITDINMESIWYCYDDQTEILTDRRGWQKFVDLTDGGMVATMEPHSGRFSWQKPTASPALDYVGPLINPAGLDLMVTPNHRMVTNYLTYKACRALRVPAQQGEGTYLIPAAVMEASLNRHMKVPVTAKSWLAHDLPDMLIPSSKGAIKLSGLNYSAFMGLYLSEGSCSPGQVRIWQERDGKNWTSVAIILQ